MTERLLLKNGHVVPGGDRAELPRADVRVEAGRIAAIGPDLDGAGADEVDATGLVVLPGLVDGHRHVWQAPLRGVSADMTLPEYFRVVLGRALPRYRPEDAHLATVLGAAEALDAGITTVFDWSNATLSPQHTDAIVDGFAAAGIRAVVGHTDPTDEAEVRRLAGRRGLVTGGMAVLGFEFGDWTDTVNQLALARELGIPVSMHAHGGETSPIRRAYEAGLLGPHLNLVHLNDITAEQAKLIADTGSGTTVTPVVEATMGHGASAFGRLRTAGARPGLGSDVVVNAPPDLFEPMRDTVRDERRRTGTMWPAATVLAAATLDSARAIGLDGQVGTVEVGKRADLVLLDGLGHLTGSADPVAGAAVAALGPANVRTVLVDGHFVKRDGVLLAHDLATLRYRAAATARRALAP
jgi:cytosine/adenosine deaminase-related metal-dependent hydrolase